MQICHYTKMKKILFILLALIVILVVWLNHINRSMGNALIAPRTNMVVESQRQLAKDNSSEIVSSTLVPQLTNIADTNESNNEPINALTVTNLTQWKIIINGLHKSPGLTERWDMEQTNRTAGIPIVLAENGKSVSFKVRFIDVEPLDDGTIRKVEMHSPIMNIDETRELGSQLCNMLGRDPSDFLAWCDKVGNHWLDSTLFSSGGSRMSNGDKFAGFGMLHSYDDDKPWYIDFFITSP